MYQLIAFDMDGTLLNSGKVIGERTKAAIERAAKAGKEVAFCTGRAPVELRGFPEQLPGMRYAICNNGAAVWDLREKKKLCSALLDPELMLRAMELSDPEDYLIQFYLDEMQYSDLSPERLGPCGMLEYLPMYERLGVPVVPDLRERLAREPQKVEKLALHFPGKESRLRAEARIKAAGLPLNVNYGNKFTLEFTVPGTTKGLGLRKLCDHLKIPLSEAIAVGDSENDNEAIAAAGLGVAMGNATEELKRLADAIVADNDHDGCAEAIDRFLLGEEKPEK